MLRTALAHKKYFITVVALSSILLAIFTTVLYQQYKSTQNYSKWVLHSHMVLRMTNLSLIYLLDVESGQRGYMLTGSHSFLRPYNESLQKMDRQLEDLVEKTADNPDQYKSAKLLQQKIGELKKIMAAQMLRYGAQGGRGIKGEDLKLSNRKMQEIRAIRETIAARELDILQERLESARVAQRQYLVTLIAGSVLALGGLIAGNFGVFWLMARNRKAQEKLQESEERYATVLNGLNDGIFDYDILSDKIYISSSYKAMLGYADHELESGIEVVNDLIHPEDREKTWENFRQYLGNSVVEYRNTFRMRHKNGSWRWIMARGVGIRGKNKKYERLIGTHTDITEHKEREQEFQQLNADLQGFTYLASHDLRAPLVNMKGFAGEIEFSVNRIEPLLSRAIDSLPKEEQEAVRQALQHDLPESLVFMRAAVEKMDKLTTGILELSRVGARKYNMVPTDINAVLKRCADAFAYETSLHKIKIEYGDMPQVTTDQIAIEQIFGNIIDNAIKYLDPARPGHITIEAKEEGASTVFSIRDNGRGIAENERGKVFDIFRRASNAGNVRGTGMGMPYVQAILRKLGGKIWFESVLGQGTVFHFSLPVAKSMSKAA